MANIDAVKDAVLEKLQKDPLSITTEDARRLSENYEAQDATSAKIISAVESLAVAAQDIHKQTPSLGQDPQTSLLTLINDLKVAVDAKPQEVTSELLKTTQAIVSKMQKAIGQTNAPHPELEAELQEEFARIVPKVERGTVTKEEADRLHSLEARAHGHTEKGGLTAAAQSVAAKRERALSLSDNTNANRTEQSPTAEETELKMAKVTTALPKTQENVTKDMKDGVLAQSDELRTQGQGKKGALAAEAQHFANRKPAVETV